MLPDGEDHHRRAHVDQLETHDRLLGGSRRDGEARVLREPAEQLHGSLEDLLEVEDGLGEVAGDRPAVRVSEAEAVGLCVHVVAVSRVGRDASGARVRVGQEPELLERSHLVADRGARDTEAGALGDRLGADGLPRPDVLLDHRVQDRGLPGTELVALLHHGPHATGTLGPRVLGETCQHQSTASRASRSCIVAACVSPPPCATSS